MSGRDEALSTFQSIVGCDDTEFAISFLEANDWNLEAAVNNYLGGDAGGVAGGLPSMGAGFSGDGGIGLNPVAMIEDPQDRAPIPQYTEQLMGGDPAMRMPSRPAPQRAATGHRQEAFRDLRQEGEEDGSMDSRGDVFGLTKKPKNLAEIYKAPTDMCFVGTFDDLREAGRMQRRWLLINIQSPTEFASQQLNADTWGDETLRAIINASFLFWQQYFDAPDGATFSRYYLQHSPQLPHIGVIDPVTGQMMKSWTGFVSAERLMDKLTEYADDPPADLLNDPAAPSPASVLGNVAQLPLPSAVLASAAQPFGDQPLGGQPLGGQILGRPTTSSSGVGAAVEDTGLVAAITTSLEGGSTVALPEESTWDDAPSEPAPGSAGVTTLRMRLPNGQNYQRTFSKENTLYEVLCAVVHGAGHELATSKAYQLTTMGSPPLTDLTATLSSHNYVGRLAVTLSER